MKAIPEKELLKEEVLKKSISPPFPQALHAKKGIRNAAEILEVLRQVKVNIPLLDMIKQVPTHDWRKGSGESLVRFGSKCEFASISSTSNWALEKEEGPEELCIIDTLVEEQCNQNMQDKLNESLVDFEEVFLNLLWDLLLYKNCLMEVLKRCKKAIGWQISDLKGISPLVCTHHIYMEEEAKSIHQEKTTFTCPFGTYAYRRMPFGLCNAPATFQRCMLSIFSDMVERIMEVFMDDITVYGGTFEECLVNLEAVLHRCIEKDLVLNWEKCHFMVRQGIVLGHIISEKGIEVDKAKVELIVKLPSPTTVKGVSGSLAMRDFAIGAVLGQREDGKPYVIYYAKFDLQIKDKKGVENVVADHLSRTENTSLPKFMLIIGKSPFSSSIVQIRSLGNVFLKMSSKGFYLIVMRMHVEATLPLRKQL
ncbi:hypothetical protein AAG906_008495 [Vitis piasezkii]